MGLSGPVPARVPADVQEAVLKSVDDAVAAGLAHTWVCGLWQVSDSRLHRWRVRRRDTGTLVDRAPGGHPVHALLSEEIAAILDVAERWGTVDRSHRKLAHRGSDEHLVWVSPATFPEISSSRTWRLSAQQRWAMHSFLQIFSSRTSKQCLPLSPRATWRGKRA